jgi:hypothetical protein
MQSAKSVVEWTKWRITSSLAAASCDPSGLALVGRRWYCRSHSALAIAASAGDAHGHSSPLTSAVLLANMEAPERSGLQGGAAGRGTPPGTLQTGCGFMVL